MRTRLSLTVILLFIAYCLQAQQQSLFQFNGIVKKKNATISKLTRLQINKERLSKLFQDKDENILLELPIENNVVVLQLHRTNPFAKNVSFILASTLKNIPYTPGYCLQGKISGDANSMAAISLFEDHAAGIVSYNGYTYNLAPANTNNDFSSNDYVIYAEKDCTIPRPGCFTAEEPVMQFPPVNAMSRSTALIGCPVDMYFQAAYRMYLGQGSSETNVLNYLTILFNTIQLIYANENIGIQIREILVWDVADPEDGMTTTSTALNSFRTRMSTGFNGDLAHYVTYKDLGGGRATLRALCEPSKVGVSGNMTANYTPYPNYSFTINVIAHEVGHNLGSPHTHSCSWPGGAIDNCYDTEGGCPAGPAPVGGGTIMSYCHLSTGINLANGFGPLPGDKIRSVVTEVSNTGCICQCGDIKLDVTTQDIGCGSPTGSATAVVTDGNGPFTYEWSTGETTASITGLAVGTYYVKVTGTGVGFFDCSVIKGFKIISTGSALNVALSPSTTTVTRCINENYALTSNITPSGTYNYQWYKNSVAIAGATLPDYTANTSGDYYLSIDNGTCVGQSATIQISFQNIATPVINVTGSANICVNETATLSVSSTSYSIEWRRNGVPIAGATSNSYSATTAGNYTVRIYSPTNASCVALSAPVTITVRPIPQAVTNPTGTISFCAGNQSTIDHSPAVSGETYQWYRNGSPISGATNSSLDVTTSGDYKLQVTGINGCKNTSDITTVTANPLPSLALNPSNVVTLCDGGTLQIRAEENAAYSYEWYDGTQVVPGQTTSTITVAGSGNYSVKMANTVTGCSSTSNTTNVTIIPPPRISAGVDTILATGQQYTLHAYELSNLGIDHYTWSPATGLDNPLSQNPHATLNATQEYVVTGTHPSGCKATDTVLIKVLQGPALYVPSAFSPNGDGTNDILHAYAVGLKAFYFFEVYNRNGQRVFRTTNPVISWDGKWKGVGLDSGTYVWYAKSLDYRGKVLDSKGTLVIIR